MVSVVRDKSGSASPLITALLLILMLGLLFSVAGVILNPFITTALGIDWIMYNMFLASPIIGLFIIASWAFVQAQRGKGVK